MKVAITITARMKSKRLPLKVIRYIKGKPMIEHMIERLKLSKLTNEIILCTSTNPQDDILIDIAEKTGIPWFRGSEEDVLERLYQAAKKYGIDFIVGTTADNPLVDPKYIDKMIKKFKETNADYIKCENLPLGAYSYGIKVKALERVMQLKKEKDTEIWGKFFEDVDYFKKIEMDVEKDLKHPEIRLTVDEKEDLALIKKIFSKFYEGKNDFDLKEILEYLLANPNLQQTNQQTTINESERNKIESTKKENNKIDSWNPIWNQIFENKEWGKYPETELVRFIARNYYNANKRKNIKILDLGCGPGANSWFMAREGFDVHSFDGSSAAIKLLKQRFEKNGLSHSTKIGEIIKIPYENNYFDCVIEIECLSCNKREDIKKAVDEIHRTLKKGGKLYSQFFGKQTWGYGKGEKIEEGTYTKIKEGTLVGVGRVHFTDKKEIEEIFSRFEKIHIEVINRTTNGGKNIQEYIMVATK